ncbi:CBU_0592 family membrane protein [Tropicimonas aquimaris]|uniref:CBU-0592-like domain-containing protein n=1 Tax=Tropicimonas aquimaris TaxID=914152 RepID=A0ABW3ILA6_9RHOB
MIDHFSLPAHVPLLLQICGVIGSVIYVGGFALVQCEHVCGNGTGYAVSKIIAAMLVLLSLIDAFNLGSFLIQIGFITFGYWGLTRRRPGTAEIAAAESDAVAGETEAGRAPLPVATPRRAGTPGVSELRPSLPPALHRRPAAHRASPPARMRFPSPSEPVQ